MTKKSAKKEAPAAAAPQAEKVEKVEKSEDELKKTTTDDGSSSDDEVQVEDEPVNINEEQKRVAEAAGLGEQVGFVYFPCFN